MVQFTADSPNTEGALSDSLQSAEISLVIQQIVQQQRSFFRAGRTKAIDFRLAQLRSLRAAVTEHESEILEALQADLGKPTVEAYGAEIGVVKTEIDDVLKHLRSWAKPQRVSPSLQQLPARAQLYPEPLGVVLLIAPWNYPFQLLLTPLVGAIAAGNCALLKPSELAVHTSQVVAKLIQKTFAPDYIAVVEGGVEVSQAMLAEKFDHIFFTGGTAIGKLVMQAAAQHLTPVTLELGGKSPCIVDADVNLECTARRITWGKFMNAGQTCIAPDYLLVDRQVKAALLAAMQQCIREFYGDDPAKSPDYGKVISQRHFDRLVSFLDRGTIITGGATNAEQRYIAPTIIENVSLDDPIMQDEIFGPILPVIAYDQVEEAIDLINAYPKPLALYLFSRNKALHDQVLRSTSSGGVCINDTIMHLASANLPFGGVGDSGMGRYRGKFSFDTFSHFKSVLARPFWLEVKWRYAPYADKLALMKRLLG